MFLKKTASVFATQVVMFVVSFATSIIIARNLGPEGKGELALLTTFLGFLALITGLGLVPATIYHLSHEPASQERIAGSAAALQLVITLATILLALLFLPLIYRLVLKGQVPLLLIAISLMLTPLSAITTIQSAFLIGLHQVGKYNYMRLVPGIVHLCLLTVLLLLSQLQVLTVIVSSAIAALVTGLLAVCWLSQIGFRPHLRPSIAWLRTLLNYGVRGWLGSIAQQFNYRLDVFIVNAFVGVAGVGQYSLAVTLAETLWYIPDSVGIVLFPRTAADQKAAIGFTPMVTRNTAFVTTIAALALAVISRPFMTLVYGSRFAPSVSPFLALLPGIVSLSIGKVLSNDLAGHGKPEYGAWSAAVSLTTTLLLDFLLIPRIGITGAGLASTISYTTSTVVLLYLYTRLSGNSATSVLFLRSSDLRLYADLFRKVTTRIQRYGESRG